MTVDHEETGSVQCETREDIPLKTRAKSSRWYRCDDECLSGSKFINVAFCTLTLVITAALLLQIYYGDYQVVPHGSVATDNVECSKIGTSTLKQGGNAVDAAISSAVCLAVVAPHLTGLAAGGQIMIYNHKTRHLPTVVDFGGSFDETTQKLPKLILGLAYAHKNFGKLPWKKLIQPSATLARKGYLVSKMLVQAIHRANADSFGRLEPGQMLHQEILSKTLSKIAEMPEEELYEYVGETNQITETKAEKFTYENYDIFVQNSQKTATLFAANLKEIETFNFTRFDSSKPEYIYRVAETTVKSYAHSNLTSKFHKGVYSNVAVIDLDDTYVSLVSGLYELFGSGDMTTHGYILDVTNKNNSGCFLPLIITDKNYICGRRMVFGTNDVALATQMVVSLVTAQRNVTESSEAPRFHIRNDTTLAIEYSHLPSFDDATLKYLKTLSEPQQMPEPYESINVIEKNRDELSSHSDSRGGGIASRF